jgi:RNA recognition motif-containing protein
MPKKIFVGGLSWNTDDLRLRTAFTHYGEIVEARVVRDRSTGRSRGFGFVTFKDPKSAHVAIDKMNGAELDGRTLNVNEAKDRPRGSNSRLARSTREEDTLVAAPRTRVSSRRSRFGDHSGRF